MVTLISPKPKTTVTPEGTGGGFQRPKSSGINLIRPGTTPPPATPPTPEPSLAKQTFTGIPGAAKELYTPLAKDVLGLPKKALGFIGDKLSETKFFKEAAAGLELSDEKDFGVKTLEKAASLVGGSAPENLPIIGRVIEESKHYINSTGGYENAPDLDFSNWIAGMKGGAQDVAKFAASYPLTFYGAASKHINPLLGLPDAPGADPSGAVSVDIPGLGETTNVQERINQMYAERSVPETLSPEGLVTTGTLVGFELLSGLFGASMIRAPFQPRPTVVSGKGTKPATEVIYDAKTQKLLNMTTKPKSFKLQQTKSSVQFVPKSALEQIAGNTNVKFNSKFNPNLNTYFRVTETTIPGGEKIGVFMQIRPSFFNSLKTKFGGNTNALPVEAFVPVATSKPPKPTDVKPQIAPPASKPVVPPTPKPVVPPTPKPVVPPMPKPGVPPVIVTPAPTEKAPAPVEKAPEPIKEEKKVVKEPTKKPGELRIKPAPKKKPGEEIEIKGEKVKVPEQLVNKTQIKGLVQAHGGEVEFTYDGSHLTYKDKNTDMRLRPSALGLVDVNLKKGQKVTITSEDLKATGPGFRGIDEKGEVFASIGSFRDEAPISVPGAKNLKNIELPEMVQLARELMGLVPKVRTKVSRKFGGGALGVFRPKDGGEITLRADLFDPAVHDAGQVAKTLAHEIGHLTDYLPDKSMKRGNIMGRLLTLNNFRKDFFLAAGQSRTATAINKELWELSKHWKPLVIYEKMINANTGKIEVVPKEITEAETPAGFLKYRKSPPEIYADFISVIFNDPVLAERMAPEAYNLFFENLDKKPLVKEAYFETQALLTGERIDIVKARRKGVQDMFGLGETKSIDIQKAKLAERQNNLKDFLTNFKFATIDKNYPMIDRYNKLVKEGVHINPDDNPIFKLEERNYVGGKIKAVLETDFAPIYESLMKADIPWSIFGEEMFYQRIVKGDRSTQANPRGITVDAARELSNDLRKGLESRQIAILDKALADFNKGIKKIAEEAYEAGLYTPELYKKMKANPAYATFQVLDYMEENHTSVVHKSIGTFRDIENPADATILKMTSTIRAIERNLATKASIDMLKLIPGEVEPAQAIFTSKNARRFIAKKGEPETEPVIYYEKGKAKGFYVDPYVKASIDNASVGHIKAVTVIMSPLRYLNKTIFRPLFIVYNPGFQAFNLIRDFKRFWKNMPHMTITRAMKLYTGDTYRLARTRAFGPKVGKDGVMSKEYVKALEDLHMLEKEKVFSVTFNDIALGETYEDLQIERIMHEHGLAGIGRQKREGIMKVIMTVPDFIKKVGDLIETLPKGAAFYEFTGGNRGLTPAEASHIRKFVGSPDFFAGGYLKPVTNEVALFSNAITQGIRSDIIIATDPKTRGGYWWKTAAETYLPKILMMGASLGLFGATVKEMMDDVSEYDKTNYTIIPLGKDENGKTVYVRIPSDETGRFLGGITWKAFSGQTNDVAWNTDLAQILSYTGGQLPSITPGITTPNTLYKYIQGQNPYDPFRGRPILTTDVYNAGGSHANKAMLKWTFNQMGGGVIQRFQVSNTTPQTTGAVEKTVQLPVISNILGRFLRVSDYGTKENLSQIAKNVAKEEARERLDRWQMIYDYVEEAQKDTTFGTPAFNKRDYENRLVDEWFGDIPHGVEFIADRKALKKSFALALTKSDARAETQALISAGSNDQKEAILNEIRKTMPEEEYQSFIREVQKSGVISLELRRKVD